MNRSRPIVALTLGDVAGVGPETVVRAITAANENAATTIPFQPLVVGHPRVVERALRLIGHTAPVRKVSGLHEAVSGTDEILCWNPSEADVADVAVGKVDPRAGRAAYDWLVAATRAALTGTIDAIVTAPLHKYALHQAGFNFPGHTEILAHECGVADYAMMLYHPGGAPLPAGHALSIAHVTLHTSIASVPGLLSRARIQETIQLMDRFLRRIDPARRRIGVCALNPHAGEDGLFGDEESRLIAPAVEAARAAGNDGPIDAAGPFPADTLIKRGVEGEFDGIVAMYHDQGHIALKLIGFHKAVNVTLGLPIIRTSPSQGTAFDIAWQGKADPAGMQAAIGAALRLVETREPRG